MAESNIPMHALIFRCGWETKSLHTILSYIFTSLSNGMIRGKNLSYWLFKQSNEIYRGVPTTLDDIKTAPDLVICFVNYLSFHRTQLTHKTNFNHILAA